MRMWLVDPSIMCRQHLLGEHCELHMFVGTINAGINVQTYIDTNLLDIDKIYIRHRELVNEMERRGYNHKSPLPEFYIKKPVKKKSIDIKASQEELYKRCDKCGH